MSAHIERNYNVEQYVCIGILLFLDSLLWNKYVTFTYSIIRQHQSKICGGLAFTLKLKKVFYIINRSCTLFIEQHTFEDNIRMRCANISIFCGTTDDAATNTTIIICNNTDSTLQCVYVVGVLPVEPPNQFSYRHFQFNKGVK